MSGTAIPSVWYLIGTQAMSTIGDAFGQRSLRAVFGGKRRHMLIAVAFVSATQVALLLGAFQIFAPTLTSIVYAGRTEQPCYQQVDVEGMSPCYCNQSTLPSSFIEGYCNSTSHPIQPLPNCTEIACPSQGPGSIWYSIYLHPLLLLNGLQDVLYYIGEIWLYREPLGLVIIVVAALASTFIINPIGEALGLRGTTSIPPAVLVLGIVGALLGTIEVPPPAGQTLAQMYRYIFCCECKKGRGKSGRKGGEEVEKLLTGSASEPDEEGGKERGREGVINGDTVRVERRGSGSVRGSRREGGEREEGSSSEGKEETRLIRDGSNYALLTQLENGGAGHAKGDQLKVGNTKKAKIMWALRCFFPFFLLSITYCLWFVTQKVFNDVYRTNVWGYTSLDQVLLPVYMYPSIFLLGLCKPFSYAVTSKTEENENFAQAFRATFREMFTASKGKGFFTVFFYRLLLNVRAMIYFILSIQFDLSTVYMELTLIRVIMSWAVALVLSALIPKFLMISKEEQRSTFAPINIIIHVAGTVMVVIALWIFNQGG